MWPFSNRHLFPAQKAPMPWDGISDVGGVISSQDLADPTAVSPIGGIASTLAARLAGARPVDRLDFSLVRSCRAELYSSGSSGDGGSTPSHDAGGSR
jgi:hypothetical protein